MVAGLREVAVLPYPAGEILGMTRCPNGMQDEVEEDESWASVLDCGTWF